MGVAGVRASTPPLHGGGPGSSPRAALPNELVKVKEIRLKPIPYGVARSLLVKHHYTHSISASTRLCLGAFVGDRLLGVVQFTCGNKEAHRIVEGAQPEDCVTLARLWLSPELPKNSESRVIAMSLRLVKRYSPAKFVVTYADGHEHHRGVVYMASNFLFLGKSESRNLIDLGDGKARHTRTISHRLGSSSLGYVRTLSPKAKAVTRPPKFKFLYFLDGDWTPRLKVPTSPYPRDSNGH